MTLREACQRLGKSETTLRRWIRTGKLKAELAKGKYEIDLAEIECLVDDQVIGGNAESVEASAVIDQMTRQMVRQDEEIEFLRKELSEQGKRHDTIIMQMTQQLDRVHLQLEDLRQCRTLWQRIKGVFVPETS